MRPFVWRLKGRLAVAGVLAFLGVCGLVEVGLRQIVGLGHPVCYTLDTACGYIPQPNQNMERFGQYIHINAQQMRSAELPAIKPVDDYRVLIVGDSVTFGTTRVDQELIFSTRLQPLLQAQLHRPVEVLNASAGGWAVGNEVGYVQSRGIFTADTVLLVLNTGDLVQPFSRLKPEDALNYPQHAPLSAIGELLQRYVGPRLFHTNGPASDSGSIAAAAPDAINQLRPVLESLDLARKLIEASHAKFGIAFVPAVSSDWQQPGYDAALVRLKQWAAEHTVPLWDLTPEMTARPMGELYQDGIHPTAAGHAVIAERLARELGTMSP